MARVELVAGEAEAGARLDALLAARPEIGSRGAAERLLRAGRVAVDGRARAKSHRVAPGERIEVALEEASVRSAAPVPSAPQTVVYEDDHLIVVDKPAGVVVHPGHGRREGTLAQALAGRTAGGPAERRGIVHRLDRDTSGLLVVAGSEEAYAALVEALRRRAVSRGYLALVDGVPDARTGMIDAPVGRDRGNRTRMSTASDRGRWARTHFSVREALGRTALLDVELDTGRTHQIRAHLAAIGHSVCGDGRYGGAAAGQRIGLERQFLHAARLELAHPVTGERLELEAPLPDDLRAALDRARAEPSSGR